MPNTLLSEALREAYASASDVVILHTLELRHPSFLDDDGQPIAIRVVRDNQDLTARLEAGAPLNSGAMVTFIAMGFDLELPPIDTAPVPEISITLDNASREIVKHLDAASDSQSKIEVTYRPLSGRFGRAADGTAIYVGADGGERRHVTGYRPRPHARCRQ